MADLFSSALSGMNAAQAGLATTQHNIANASTPGFTRQQVLVSARPGQQVGSGFIGQGVDIVGVKRIYDQFLSGQVLQNQNQSNYLNTYYSAMQPLDAMISDPTTGASSAMQGVFDAFNVVANTPESTPARQTLLGSLQFTVNRFQALDQRLTDSATAVTGQIASSVQSVNSYATQIAVLNGSIKRAGSSGNLATQPNDLLDQRDQLITKLNQEIKTTALPQPDGTVNVFIGTGQALVIDEQSMRLQTVQAARDPSKVDIAYSNAGKTTVLQQSSLQGGNLGAYMDFRDKSLEPARNALGRAALGLAISLNQQNQLGQDLSGSLGGNLINPAAPRVDKNAGNNPASGIPTVTISSVAGLTTSDYQLRFDGGTNYSLLRVSDNTTSYFNSLPQTIDGMTIAAPVSVAAGDNWLIRPTANAARDIALLTTDTTKIAAAAPIRGAAALSNIGTATIDSGVVNAPPPVNTNLQATVSLTFTSPTTFTVAGAVPAVVGAVAFVSGQNITYNGWTTKVTGTPVAGDVFTVSTNNNAVGDNRNALLMSGLQTQNLMANGTLSLQGAYGQLVSDVSTKTSELSVTSIAQTSMVAQSVAAQQAVSGVNLDEEAANLIRYQKSYQASAKAVQVAQTMFDAILAIK